jgi:hypothetical protein
VLAAVARDTDELVKNSVLLRLSSRSGRFRFRLFEGLGLFSEDIAFVAAATGGYLAQKYDEVGTVTRIVRGLRVDASA